MTPPTPASPETRLAVLGLGYVGCVTAACFAHLGYRVVGVDKDAHKVEALGTQQAPFYESGLAELVRSAVAGGRLAASLDLGDGLADADVALVCVGTPSERSGDLGLGQLRGVCAEIAAQLRGRSRPLVVAVRSTVFPGTCEEIAASVFRETPQARLVSNPEFLREGSAIQDFLEPSLVVVGGADGEAVRRVADLYGPLGVEPCLVSLRTAEMIKYACNAFHAVKVAFANEIGTLARQMGVPGDKVMQTLCQDTRLNISPAYLKPGFAFGGSCLPKDLRALTFRAGRLDLDLPLLRSVLPSNQSHLARAIQAALDLPVQRLGLFGLAFKENTDDLRESPVVTLIEQLLGKGREIRVFDPHIQLDRIYGSNREFILRTVPHIGKLLVSRWGEVLGWAEHVIVAQRPSPPYAETLRAGPLPVLDLTTTELPRGTTPGN
jgi:GDP-mannose 6-dehydrogenase